MATYKTPGVYIEEISKFPPSVAEVETAIPAFVGYTKMGPVLEPVRIGSMVDYENIFGGPALELPDFEVDGSGAVSAGFAIPASPKYKLYYALQLFFANGGGPCYIVSAGKYKTSGPKIDPDELADALAELYKEDEPTLLLIPDATSLPVANLQDYHDLLVAALKQCGELKDRFAICDVYPSDAAVNPLSDAVEKFRGGIGASDLMYGAAYAPYLRTSLTYVYEEKDIKVEKGSEELVLRHSEESIRAADDPQALRAQSLFHVDNNSYHQIRKMIDEVRLVMPPSPAIAGVYASVDRTRGVWKAPANVSLSNVVRPVLTITAEAQKDLNKPAGGKAINAIRSFVNKGVLVWGARTLDGNDNEWRYISVRRFFNMVEESVKKASEPFVFEPNDANTWVKVKGMIENFLTLQWRAGALQGSAPTDAFYVKVGLGETMTGFDVLEGRMIVEIGMAVVRPAEFIILRFSHKMMTP